MGRKRKPEILTSLKQTCTIRVVGQLLERSIKFRLLNIDINANMLDIATIIFSKKAFESFQSGSVSASGSYPLQWR